MPIGKWGVHSSLYGNTAQNQAVANALGATCFTWLMRAHQPSDALMWPDATHILRLWNPGPTEDAHTYAARIAGDIQMWTGAGIHDLWIQVGCEPEQQGFDLQTPWTIVEWKVMAPQYADVLRQRFPNIPFLAAPFTAANISQSDNDYAAAWDGVALHWYWPNTDFQLPTLGNLDTGTIPVFYTEVNANPTTPDHVATFLQHMQYEGATIFMADAIGTAWPFYDLSVVQAKQIRALVDGPLLPVPHPAPPPPPPPPVVPDYLHFRGLSWDQYQQIITTGTMAGRTSPMLNRPDYDALIGAMQDAQIDPRLPLAFTWSEGHHGSDPGLVAAAYNNLGGIKYSGAPGTYDTGIAADTGGTYAGFPDLRPYYVEWVRIMQNNIIGPDFRSGNLIGAVEHYTNGPGTGHNKVTQYEAYVADYPESPVTPPGPSPQPPPPTGVTLADILRVATDHIGKTITDEGNAEFGMCEQEFEEWCEEAGLPRVRYASAAADGDVLLTNGALHTTMPPPPGAGVIWGRSFDPEGHICCAAEYPFVITTYPGKVSRIDAVANGWYGSVGFLGWFVPNGATIVVPPPTNHLDDAMIERLWYGDASAANRAKRAYNPQSGIGQRWRKELLAGNSLGTVQSGEESDTPSGRILQYFTNAVITYITATGETFVN